jgi:hypothetical protein
MALCSVRPDELLEEKISPHRLYTPDVCHKAISNLQMHYLPRKYGGTRRCTPYRNNDWHKNDSLTSL